MKAKLSISDAFRKAWKITAKNWLVLVGLTTAYLALNLVLNFLFSSEVDISYMNYHNNPENILFVKKFTAVSFLTAVLQLLFACSFTYVIYSAVLDCIKGIEPRFRFSLRQIFYCFITQIVIIVISLALLQVVMLLILSSIAFFMLGTFLLIILFFYFGIRIQFYINLIVDKDMMPYDAVKESWNLTKRNQGKLLLLVLLQSAIVVAGFIALGIGVLYAIPLVIVLQVCIYKQLQNNSLFQIEENFNNQQVL